MALLKPVVLEGENLGQRHLHFNKLVTDIYKNQLDFYELCNTPELSRLDRLLKIDVASKYRKVDYIIENLKHGDLLFVTRALKSVWLLNDEYADIINPKKLENDVYPFMVSTAVTKMKHWIHTHLRNEKRCQEFYEYYNKINFKMAYKFLVFCSNEFVTEEAHNIVHRITPDIFKCLIMKHPNVAKIYFDSVGAQVSVTKGYLKNEKQFHRNLTFIFKSHGNIVLDIFEKYHTIELGKLSVPLSRKILFKYKDRVTDKIELYAYQLIDTKIIAEFITAEESIKILERLARAEYLKSWFSYKNVEHFVKLLKPKDRTMIRKKVFVDKEFGDVVKNWPYAIPTKPSVPADNDIQLFTDKYIEFSTIEIDFQKTRKLKKKYCAWKSGGKTNLDRLFDEYRFTNFEKTFFELRNKLRAESDMKNRLDMVLVLISKCGSDENKVERVLNLLVEKYFNEPANWRASVIRSFVNRCSIWRCNDTVWNLVLQFARNLGLVSEKSEAKCSEGIHAAVIRNILKSQPISETLKKNYFKEFSTLKEYKLNTMEKIIISDKLPHILISDLVDAQEGYMNILRFLDTLDAYNIKLNKRPEAVITIMKFYKEHSNDYESLLSRLYSRRASRKEFIREYFKINQNDHSFLNALKHSPSLLEEGRVIVNYFEQSNIPCPNRFFRSLALYFGEKDGLAEKHFRTFELNLKNESISKITLARPLAYLYKGNLINFRQSFTDKNTHKAFIKQIKANSHLVEPFPSLDDPSLVWIRYDTKTLVNYLMNCRQIDVERHLAKIIKKRKLANVAFIFSKRCGNQYIVFKELSTAWPKLALRIGLRHMQKKTTNLNESIWKIMSELLIDAKTSDEVKLCFVKKAKDLIGHVPLRIIEDFAAVAYAVTKAQNLPDDFIFVTYIGNSMTENNVELLENIALRFIDKELKLNKLCDDNYDIDNFTGKIDVIVQIIARLLLFCKSEDKQQSVLNRLGTPFFDTMHFFWTNANEKSFAAVKEILETFLLALKFNRVFLGDYASPMPVFYAVTNFMTRTLDYEKWIVYYIQINLNILYYKSIKICKDNCQDIFKEETKKRTEGIAKVGYNFGRFIGEECDKLINNNFPSVFFIFKKVLLKYLNNYLKNEMKIKDFPAAVVNGVLESNCSDDSKLLAVFIYHYNLKNDKKYDALCDKFKASNNIQMSFFLNK